MVISIGTVITQETLVFTADQLVLKSACIVVLRVDLKGYTVFSYKDFRLQHIWKETIPVEQENLENDDVLSRTLTLYEKFPKGIFENKPSVLILLRQF